MTTFQNTRIRDSSGKRIPRLPAEPSLAIAGHQIPPLAAIEERRVGFRVRRVVYPVGRTSRHRLPPSPLRVRHPRLANRPIRVEQGRRGARPSRRDEHGACGTDLAQHGRDRIDQGAAICLRMASLQRGLGWRSDAADELCELHRSTYLASTCSSKDRKGVRR